MRTRIFPNLFKNYQKSGRCWLSDIDPETRKIFSEIGQSYHGYGHLGGVKRAQSAQRDAQGRFVITKESA